MAQVEQTIQKTLALELAQLPESRRQVLSRFFVPPYRQIREHGYRPGNSECWIFAESQSVLLCYCLNGLSKEYCWGILERETADLGADDRWHLSMDHAFMNSGLCDRSLVPNDYEVP